MTRKLGCYVETKGGDVAGHRNHWNEGFGCLFSLVGTVFFRLVPRLSSCDEEMALQRSLSHPKTEVLPWAQSRIPRGRERAAQLGSVVSPDVPHHGLGRGDGVSARTWPSLLELRGLTGRVQEARRKGNKHKRDRMEGVLIDRSLNHSEQ